MSLTSSDKRSMNAFAVTAPRDRFITLLMSSIRILLASDRNRSTSSSVHRGESCLLAARCLSIDDPNPDFTRSSNAASRARSMPRTIPTASGCARWHDAAVYRHETFTCVAPARDDLFVRGCVWLKANGRTGMGKTALEPEDFPVSHHLAINITRSRKSCQGFPTA